MRILLTGATGFVGSHLLPALGERHDVVALARREPPAELARLAEWVLQDLTEPLAGLPDRVDAVIHLAQSDRYRDFPRGVGDMLAINVASTVALLEYARAAGAGTFVFASTGGVYGPSHHALTEHAPVSPLDFYLSSKFAAELLVGPYRDLIHTIVLRFFFVYGPGQEGMLVPRLARRVLDGEGIQIQGSPGLRLNPTYVEDVVRVFEPALALDDSGLFNVAGDEVVTLTELVHMLGELAGRRPDIAYVDGGRGGDLIGDNTRMREVLGVRPEVRLRDGLAETLAALGPELRPADDRAR